MTAVDAPPGLDFSGTAEGEFRARSRTRRFTSVVLVYVLIVAGLAFVRAARHPFRPGAEFALVLPLMCASVAGLGYAIRRARLRIDATGIRWGWSGLGFRLGPERLRGLTVYRDAIAVRPRRGSMWYLSSSDWGDWDRMAGALRRAGFDHEDRDRRAPLRSRLQSYGRVLDLLMVAAGAVATFVLIAG